MLVIFDWDGTLLDSTGKIIGCMHQAISDVELEQRSDQQVKEIIGLGLPEAIQQLFPGIENDRLGAVRAAYSRHFIAADKTACDFYPGVMETMLEIKKRGHQIAVATGKSRRGLNRVLSNLQMESFFHATRCADETASKPHPLMLHELMSELESPNHASVMVGDTEFDLEMANRAGIRSIGVNYGAHPEERLQRCKPDTIIEEFAELLEFLD